MDNEINDKDYHDSRNLVREFIAAEKMESLTA
jgi:hypothetical protein